MRRHVQLPLLDGAVSSRSQHGLIIRREGDPADRTGMCKDLATDRRVFVEILSRSPQRDRARAVSAGPLVAVNSKSRSQNFGRVPFE